MEIAPTDMSTQGDKSTVDTGVAVEMEPTPEKDEASPEKDEIIPSTGKFRKFMNRKYLMTGMAIVLFFVANIIVCGLLSLPIIFYNSQHHAEVRPCLKITVMIIWSYC